MRNTATSSTEVYVKINECSELPPDNLYLNVDIVALKDNAPAPDQIVILQMENQKMEATTGENGVARGIDVLFQHVNAVRKRLKAWAEGANNKVFECDIIVDAIPSTEEDLASSRSEKEYELIKGREAQSKSIENYTSTLQIEAKLKIKVELMEAAMKQARAAVEKAEKELNHPRPEIRRTEIEINKAETAIKKAQAAMDKAYKELKRPDAECERLSNELNKAQKEAKEAHEKCRNAFFRDLHATCIKKEEELSKAYNANRNAEAKAYGKVNADYQQAFAELQKAQAEYDKGKKENSSVKAEYDKAEREVTSAQAEYDKLEKECSSLQTEYCSAKAKSVQAEKARREVYIKVATLEKILKIK